MAFAPTFVPSTLGATSLIRAVAHTGSGARRTALLTLQAQKDCNRIHDQGTGNDCSTPQEFGGVGFLRSKKCLALLGVALSLSLAPMSLPIVGAPAEASAEAPQPILMRELPIDTRDPYAQVLSPLVPIHHDAKSTLRRHGTRARDALMLALLEPPGAFPRPSCCTTHIIVHSPQMEGFGKSYRGKKGPNLELPTELSQGKHEASPYSGHSCTLAAARRDLFLKQL